MVCRDGATVGVDVRGAAPATRETDLCRPGTLVQRANAVFLTGGSAFGLDAAAGVMRYLIERGIGFPTPAGPVPIVPGAAIFDLGLGAAVWPDAEMAYRACLAASTGPVEQGCVGAGAGASAAKLRGPGSAIKSGLGSASVVAGHFVVGALAVVNALGEVVNPDTGRALRQATGESETPPGLFGRENTTLVVVATDASLSSDRIGRLATVAHDGLARSIVPAHTVFDGDVVFALSAGADEPHWPAESVALEQASVRAVERAVLNAVRNATPMGGLPALAGV